MQAILDGLGNFFITLGNYIIDALAVVVSIVLQLLPDSPFMFIMESPIGEFAAAFNWIFPVSECVVTLEVWLSAIIVYYCYQTVLRWAKAIE